MAEIFGCCSSFKECSEQGLCLHNDNPEYSGCGYRKNLEVGKNFYKKYNTGGQYTMEITLKIVAPELAGAITSLANSLSGIAIPTTTTQKAEKKEKVQNVEKTTPALVKEEKSVEIVSELEDNLSDEAPNKDPEVTYTLEQVREKLTALSQAGKQDKVKALITKHGATRLSDIPAEKYSEVMKEAEGL